MSDLKRKDRVRHKTDGDLGTVQVLWNLRGSWVVLWDNGRKTVEHQERLEKVDHGSGRQDS